MDGDVRYGKDNTYEDIKFNNPVGMFIAHHNAVLIALPSTRLDKCKYVQVGEGERKGWGNPISFDSFEIPSTRPVIRYYSQVRDRQSTAPLALTPHEVYFFMPVFSGSFSPGDRLRLTSGQHKGHVKVVERVSASGITVYFADGDKATTTREGYEEDYTVLPRSLFASRMPSVELDDGIYLNSLWSTLPPPGQRQLAPGELGVDADGESTDGHYGEAALKYYPWHPPMIPPTDKEMYAQMMTYSGIFLYRDIITKAVNSGKVVSVRTWLGSRIECMGTLAADYTEDVFWEGLHSEVYNMLENEWRLEETGGQSFSERSWSS